MQFWLNSHSQQIMFQEKIHIKNTKKTTNNKWLHYERHKQNCEEAENNKPYSF